MSDRTLFYHWFSQAHVASSHLISGVDLPTAMFRLWDPPVFAIVLGLVVALCTRSAAGPGPRVSGALMRSRRG